MDISFKFDPEIIIGADTMSLAGTICGRFGERIMVAADQNIDSLIVNRLKFILEDSRIEAIVYDGIQEDSSVDIAGNIVELCCAAHCNAIIGLGGPRTQLITRMAALMAALKISVFELLEGRKCMGKFLPFIAIPTEGTDTFAFTGNFIAADPRDRLVKSIEAPGGLCAAVIIDSSLFKFLSGPSAAAAVFGGFFTAVEAYCSSKANFLSDALLERALNFYAKIIKKGSGGIDADTYAQAAFLASLGTSLSSPGAGAALSFAINARFPVVKQAASAALLPVVAEWLVSARPEKMARVAGFLGNTGKAASAADAAAGSVDNIRRSMEAFKAPPDLKSFNLPLDRLTAAVEAARNLEFVSNSPWTVSVEAVFDILKKII
jgi:alcohol dehydrogenase